MGIKGLWKILEPTSQNTSLVELSIREGFVENRHGTRSVVVGVNASSMIYDATRHSECAGHSHVQSEKNPELCILFTRLSWMSRSAVNAVFVFDGPDLPKHNEVGPRSSRWIASKFQELITGFGYHCHTAPEDAEAELAFLNIIEAIDIILTSENDVFLFGAKQVIRSPTRCPGNIRHFDSISVFSMNHQRKSDLFTAPEFLLMMAVLSGGKYDTVGLPHCGTAISSALAKGPLAGELYQAGKALSENQLHHFLKDWRTLLWEELTHDPHKRLGQKYPGLAERMPAMFPDPKVVKQYCCPITSHEIPENAVAWLIPTTPNTADLANLCDDLFDWGPDIIDRFISHVWDGLLIRKIIKNFHGSGTTIPAGQPSFIAPTVDGIQKIRSSPSRSFSFYQVSIWIPSLTAEAATAILDVERPKRQPNNVVHGLTYSHSMSVWIPAPLFQITNPEVIANYYQNNHRHSSPEIASAVYSPVLRVEENSV